MLASKVGRKTLRNRPFHRRLPDTVLKVTSRPIFVSRCITVTWLLFLWACIRHENVMRALVLYAFFLKVLTVAL